MDKAQTESGSEAPATPQEERTARHLRMLARAAEVHMEMNAATPPHAGGAARAGLDRAAEVHMEIIEATRTEAVEAPQPGVDYGQRIAVITKSLRLTMLLEEK